MTLPDETSPTPDSTSTHAALPAAEPVSPLRAVVERERTAGLKRPARKSTSSVRKSISYADAGVDITSGDRSKQRIKMLARKTFNKHVLSEIGGFGGLFSLDLEKFPNPVLVSSCDGVGTKLKVAFELGIHHTVGAGPRESLRQRHRRAGRHTALLPRLSRHREAG